jgi:hypothetical protein
MKPLNCLCFEDWYACLFVRCAMGNVLVNYRSSLEEDGALSLDCGPLLSLKDGTFLGVSVTRDAFHIFRAGDTNTWTRVKRVQALANCLAGGLAKIRSLGTRLTAVVLSGVPKKVCANYCILARLLMLAGCVMLSNRDRYQLRPCYFGNATLNGILVIRIIQFIKMLTKTYSNHTSVCLFGTE